MVTLHTIDGGTVNAINDALLYDFIIGQNGIASGATVTSEGALLLHIDSGWGVIKGRIFSIEAETISATPSTSGTVKGRLILQIDITNTTSPVTFVTQAAATLPALQQEDINGNGTIFQLPIATYDVNEVAVSNLQMVAPVVEAINQMYPVGSIYMSVNDTNPHDLFGGTWEQIKDRFLLAAGDTYAAGRTGGEAQHKLTVDEMPSHNHVERLGDASDPQHANILKAKNKNGFNSGEIGRAHV